MNATKKQNAGNNGILAEIKRGMNSKIYSKAMAILNAEGEDACRAYMGQFFNDEARERCLVGFGFAPTAAPGPAAEEAPAEEAAVGADAARVLLADMTRVALLAPAGTGEAQRAWLKVMTLAQAIGDGETAQLALAKALGRKLITVA
jgi:hypothetical protein